MEEGGYLVGNYNIGEFVFSKPKSRKDGEYLLSKVNYSREQCIIQFPKMKIAGLPELVNLANRTIELEFVNTTSRYNKKTYDFLSKLDAYIIEYIHNNSELWFSKKIPLDNVKQMYLSVLKAPKNTESNCTVNFSFKKSKNQMESSFYDKKGETLELSELKVGTLLEPIVEFKYLLFSKDSVCSIWEIHTAKVYTFLHKVPKFGFIEDPDDKQNDENSDNEELDIKTFF